MSKEDNILVISLLILLLVIGYIVYEGILKEHFFNTNDIRHPFPPPSRDDVNKIERITEKIQYECKPCYSFITGERRDACTLVKKNNNDSSSLTGSSSGLSTSSSPGPSTGSSSNPIFVPISVSSMGTSLPATVTSPLPPSSPFLTQSVASFSPYVAPAFPTSGCIMNWNGTCLTTSQRKGLLDTKQSLFVVITTSTEKQIYLPLYTTEYVSKNINTSNYVRKLIYNAQSGINLITFENVDVNKTKLTFPFNIVSISIPSGYTGKLSSTIKNGTTPPPIYLSTGQNTRLNVPVSVDPNIYKEVRLSITLL